MQTLQRLLVVISLMLAVVALGPSPASAHTGFDSSDPENGAVVDGPVDTITLVFTAVAEPAGAGFEVREPSGDIRTPTEAVSDDGSTWVLTFDPPLGEGTVGVRWRVKAPDAHPIAGGFTFTITPPVVPEETEAASSVTTEVPAAADPVADEVVGDEGASEDEMSDRPAASDNVAEVDENGAEGDEDTALPAAVNDADLAEFLDNDDGPTVLGRRVAAASRLLTLAGSLIGIGGLVFATMVLRPDRRDTGHVLDWVRAAGVLVLVGTTGEMVAGLAVESGGWWDTWTSTLLANMFVGSFGMALALRYFGGLALILASWNSIVETTTTAPPVVLGELVGVGAGSAEAAVGAAPAARAPGPGDAVPAGAAAPPSEQGAFRFWPLSSPPAVAGSIALALAHLFDGHTVVKGNRLLTGVVDVVHVMAGAVWVGGVVMLAAVLWRRRRSGRPVGALALAARFSVVAAVASVAAGVAGAALTIIVLDSPSELWSTEWGKTLLVKIVLVALAAAIGAYNHRVMIPALTAEPGKPDLVARLRATATAEALILAAVIIATALLMGAVT